MQAPLHDLAEAAQRNLCPGGTDGRGLRASLSRSRRIGISVLATCAVGVVSLLLLRKTGVDIVTTVPQTTQAEAADHESQTSVEITAGDWPWWGGPGANGIVPNSHPPETWSESEHVRWKVPLRGRGHSSPVVWNDSIYLTSAEESIQRQLLICHDRATGAERWQTVLHTGKLPDIHRKNSHASATPACDGQRVFAVLLHDGAVWASACDLQGRIEWQTWVGPYVTAEGYGSSIALAGKLVVVAGDNRGARIDRVRGSSFLAALDSCTGRVVWRIRRLQGDSYGTPLVAQIAGRMQLVMSGQSKVCAYDPENGNEIWSCRWSAERSAAAPTFSGDCVFASAVHPKSEVICVRADGHGDVTESKRRWSVAGAAADVPTPLVHDGLLFLVRDEGTVVCLDAESGKILQRRRIGHAVSASPVAADGRLYVVDEGGTCSVFALDRDLALITTNRIDAESVMASPAVSGNDLLLRTSTHLYCIGFPGSERVAQSHETIIDGRSKLEP